MRSPDEEPRPQAADPPATSAGGASGPATPQPSPLPDRADEPSGGPAVPVEDEVRSPAGVPLPAAGAVSTPGLVPPDGPVPAAGAVPAGGQPAGPGPVPATGSGSPMVAGAPGPGRAPAWGPPPPGLPGASPQAGPPPAGPLYTGARPPYGAQFAGAHGAVAPPGYGPYAGPLPPALPPEPPTGADGPRRAHRWGFGAYALAEVVFLGASALIALLFGGPSTGIGTVLAALTVPTVLAATVAILATRLRGNGPRIDLGLRWSWHDVGIGAAFGVGGLVLTIPAALIYASVVGTDEATSAVGEVFDGITAGPLLAWLAFAAVVVLGPLCEEIVYRGLLWGAMEKHGAGRWLAFALTTLIFALAHFEFARTPLLFVVAIPIGLARLLTGRLLASVVAHSINNLLPGLVLALGLLGALPHVG